MGPDEVKSLRAQERCNADTRSIGERRDAAAEHFHLTRRAWRFRPRAASVSAASVLDGPLVQRTFGRLVGFSALDATFNLGDPVVSGTIGWLQVSPPLWVPQPAAPQPQVVSARY